MAHDWEEHDEHDDEEAAGAICPMPDCGALTVAYRSDEVVERDDAEPWQFTCPRCGTEFTVPETELVFQSVPKDWLLARRQAA